MKPTIKLFLTFLALSFIWQNNAQAATHILLTNQYKFAVRPAVKTAARSHNKLILLTDSKTLVKRRPMGYYFRRISKTVRREISAKSAMVMDAMSGDILYSRNPDLPRQPASTIKVLTGIIAIDSLHKNDLVPVSRYAARMPRSKIYLRPGHEYKANDLINALLLVSANDASVALAERIGGTEKTFSHLMTARARSFGATNTVCKSASGLTHRGQHTTARDLAKIFNHAMQNPVFAKTMERIRYRSSSGQLFTTHNKALWRVRGAVGGKTGYTARARQTYVGSFRRNNHELVVAIMGSETMWDDIKYLVQYGFAKEKLQDRERMAFRANKKLLRHFKLVDFTTGRKPLHIATVLR